MSIHPLVPLIKVAPEISASLKCFFSPNFRYFLTIGAHLKGPYRGDGSLQLIMYHAFVELKKIQASKQMWMQKNLLQGQDNPEKVNFVWFGHFKDAQQLKTTQECLILFCKCIMRWLSSIFFQTCALFFFFFFYSQFFQYWLFLGHFWPFWHTLSAPRVVEGLHICPQVTFLYNWIIFRHKSGYKCRRISCSVKIILKTSILSDFDPFMGSQQFLCTHKSQILFTNVQ